MKILLVAKSTSQHAVSMQFLTKQEREQLQAQHRFERDRRIRIINGIIERSL
ncbi:transposase [Waddlia chondrophila WSU 86-1044]|uniref:Transposase n=1 Tax=Waddlia chondrophila (strain ATCC VR-1470 / WSU 86-1044) TaxID=716544 RepID=D6YS81_WADCW|nr:transposase [Waddlia chondrophila WSU 86-1044]